MRDPAGPNRAVCECSRGMNANVSVAVTADAGEELCTVAETSAAIGSGEMKSTDSMARCSPIRTFRLRLLKLKRTQSLGLRFPGLAFSARCCSLPSSSSQDMHGKHGLVTSLEQISADAMQTPDM